MNIDETKVKERNVRGIKGGNGVNTGGIGVTGKRCHVLRNGRGYAVILSKTGIEGKRDGK